MALAVGLAPAPSLAQQQLLIKPLAEAKVSELPAGVLFWRIENLDSMDQAQAGSGADHAMQVSGSGSTDLRALITFVVDADKPFSVPATLN